LVKGARIRNTSAELTEFQNILFGQLGIDLTCPEEVRGIALCVLDGSAAGQQVEDENYQGDDQEQVNQATRGTGHQAEKPQDQHDCQDGPENSCHSMSPFVQWRLAPSERFRRRCRATEEW
jgi:hypothetical protein